MLSGVRVSLRFRVSFSRFVFGKLHTAVCLSHTRCLSGAYAEVQKGIRCVKHTMSAVKNNNILLLTPREGGRVKVRRTLQSGAVDMSQATEQLLGAATASDVARIALRQYASLQRGKPASPQEWTVVAAFVLEDVQASTLKVSA